MRLIGLILQNFRAYRRRTYVEFDDLSAFIGRNDYGKSTVLEALEIFFNNSLVKIDKQDVSAKSETNVVRIGCVFGELPEVIVLDETANTTLEGEYLLNDDGHLDIHKVYDCDQSRIAAKPIANAYHPSAKGINDLHLLTNTKLKAKVKELGIDSSTVNQSSNPSLRKAIWSHFSEAELQLCTQEIPLDKGSGKTIFGKLALILPEYALFRADRPSTDSDAEIQDPMRIAIKEAVKAVQPQLDIIREEVENRAIDVANRTLKKLKEMDPDLANTLDPRFSSEPRWDGFKLTLTGDDDIPINKRGSGVRRLVLLNFFRAEAERRALEANKPNIIYAVEEPEVSQHPENQEMLIKALLELSARQGSQVVITTHVPRLAGLLPPESIRHVSRDESAHPLIQGRSDAVLRSVVEELGVLPSLTELEETKRHLKLLVCVEGTRDVEFLRRVCSLLRQEDPEIPDIECDQRIVILPLYGSNLMQWVKSNYFRDTGIREFHIYDKDADSKYHDACTAVNSRQDGSVALLTEKPSIENYFDIDLVNVAFGIELSESDIQRRNHDVIDAAVRAVKQKPKSDPIRKKIRAASDVRAWKNNAKYLLHETALPRMSINHLQRMNVYHEIMCWFNTIKSLLD